MHRSRGTFECNLSLTISTSITAKSISLVGSGGGGLGGELHALLFLNAFSFDFEPRVLFIWFISSALRRRNALQSTN